MGEAAPFVVARQITYYSPSQLTVTLVHYSGKDISHYPVMYGEPSGSWQGSVRVRLPADSALSGPGGRRTAPGPGHRLGR